MPVSMPANRPINRLIQWTAHRAAWLWATVAILTVPSDIWPHSTVLRWATVPVVAVGFWLWHAQKRHGMALCPRCADTVPLDGAAAATRRARTLRWTHTSFHPRVQFAYGVVLLGLAVLSLIATSLPALFFYWMCLSCATTSWLLSVHQPLQPWCPQCHWGRGGNEETVPDPVPDPEDHAILSQ